MSGIYSTSSYGGKQPDNTAYIKQFITTVSGYANWIYKTINSVKYITPASPEANVYLPKDLFVAGTITSPSDRELKENIKELDDSFCDRLIDVEPVQYSYKNDVDRRVRYGMIAQDLESCFPELVITGDAYKSINYIELIPIMLGKMKSMQRQIDELSRKIE